MNNSKVSAIILAGGSGSRMNSSVTKQRMMLGNISVLRRCVLTFEKCSEVDEIIVVAKESEINEIRVELADIAKLSKVVPGGASRAESAMNGVSAMNYQSDYVAIHDAARPAITSEMIEKVIFIAKEKGCATAASRTTDTLKLVDSDGKIKKTLDRNFIVRATTPQVFKREIYERALDKNKNDLSCFTDDNMLVESIGENIYAVIFDKENPKITTQDDFEYVELLLRKRGMMDDEL